MSIINFKDINCKQLINKENKTFEFNGQEIQVIPYLSVGEKYQLIMATLAKADDNGIFNPLKMHMHFNLNIVFMYTNLVFDAEDRMDEDELYDTLTQSGLIQLVLDNMNDSEIDELSNMLDATETKINQYNSGVSGMVDKILHAIEGLPEKFDKALTMLKEMAPEMQNFIDIKNNNNSNNNTNLN